MCSLYCGFCFTLSLSVLTVSCQIGSVIIALNGSPSLPSLYWLLTLCPGPQESTPSEISDFKVLFVSPGFLAYSSVLVAIALSIIIYFGPRFEFTSTIIPLMPFQSTDMGKSTCFGTS